MTAPRLLIVEDNEEIAQMMTLFLTSRGFKISVAPDAATALQMVRESLPHLILLDVGLPDITGYDLLQQLRQNPRTRHVPAIFVTQRKKRPDRIAGLELGADDFITKPFDPEELCLRAQNLVARTARDNLINPYTGLPDQRLTREEIKRALQQPGRTVLEFRLQQADKFHDLYGSLAYADLLRHLALMFNRDLNALGTAEDFFGQLSEERYIIITASDKALPLQQAIAQHFEQSALQHYSLAERAGETQVKVKGSTGEDLVIPLMKLEATVLTQFEERAPE